MKKFVENSVDIFSRMLSNEYKRFSETHIIDHKFDVFTSKFKIIFLIDSYVSSHIKDLEIAEDMSNRVYNKLKVSICQQDQ